MKCRTEGTMNSPFLIVGEHPGNTEDKKGLPFSGASGYMLKQIMHDCGFSKHDCLMTYVVNHRPPANNIKRFFIKHTKKTQTPNQTLADGIVELKALIKRMKPKIIIGLGETALWALTGEMGITKWRGSQLEYTDGDFTCWFIPSYSPTKVIMKYDWRFILQHDLRRAKKYETWVKPEYKFILSPTYCQVMSKLKSIELRADRGEEIRLAGDIETRGGHIACMGFAWSKTEAICVPFMKANQPSGYWNEREEIAIIKKFRDLFQHPNVKWVYQNGSFDLQYHVRHWLCLFDLYDDTMIAHHTCWAGLKKSLDFLSSMYCEFHVYWKDDGKHFDLEHHSEDRLWEYNCKDCVTTYEISEELATLIPQLQRVEAYECQMKRVKAAVKMMLRGVKRDKEYQASLVMQLADARLERQEWLEKIIGHPINIKSPKQMCEFFYVELGLPVVKNKKTRNPTTDDQALTTIAKKCPLVRPLVTCIQDLRSIGVFVSTFINMKADIDGRIRCSYNVAGTETYRYSSSENAFGSGGNLQNIPKGGAKDEGRFKLPNVKKMFIPDTGHSILDIDLKQADAQVVAWDSGAEGLKEVFRQGLDLHSENAKIIFDIKVNWNPDGNKYHKRCRILAKRGVHATNYAITVQSLAKSLGITMKEAQNFIDKWFGAYPEILAWHDKINMDLSMKRQVENKFGYARYYFDRVETLLPEALAWIPQSTVAIVIEKGLIAINETMPEVQPLLQVHDSLVLQMEQKKVAHLLPQVKEKMEIIIPYDDPLIIGLDAQISNNSWGEVEPCEWNGIVKVA